jgi:uncharacterized caspase-like protein
VENPVDRRAAAFACLDGQALGMPMIGRTGLGTIPRLLLLLLALGSPALAAAPEGPQKRVALVIGNSGYQGRLVLANPRNDAAAFAEALKKVSPRFEIENITDMRAADREAVLARFAKAAAHSSIALFYYAGHALQANDDNYLLPVDMPENPASLQELGALQLSSVLRAMNTVARAKLVFLDACRDNPFKSQNEALPFAKEKTRRAGLVRLRDGLANPDASAFGTGDIFIAYATAPGSVAQDGQGRNSPFTEALARYVPKQGLEIKKMQTLVAKDVKQATENKALYERPQVPWFSVSLTSDLYLWPPAATASAAKPAQGFTLQAQAVPAKASPPQAAPANAHPLPPGLGGGGGLGGL